MMKNFLAVVLIGSLLAAPATASDIKPLQTTPSADGGKDAVFTTGKNALKLHFVLPNGMLAQAAFAGDKKVAEDDYVDIYKILPSNDKPEIAFVSSNCSGTACTNSILTLVDLTTEPVTVVDQMCVSDAGDNDVKIVYGAAEIKIDTLSCLVNNLGDTLRRTYVYDRALHVLYEDGAFDKSLLKLAGAHPSSLFDEQSAFRPALLALLTEANFRTVRTRMDVSTGMELRDGRYLVGSGFTAHQGGELGQTALTIIDMKTKNVWASWFDEKHWHFRTASPLADGKDTNAVAIESFIASWAMDAANMAQEKIELPYFKADVPLNSFDVDYRDAKALKGLQNQ